MIRVISLFSGGGFAEEAMRLASERTGIASQIVMAVDLWEPAARVRDANFSDDVRTTVASVKDLSRDDFPPHDLVIGGPPCQPWSMAGKRQGADDPRDCLPDFVRLRGNCWLMENVTPRLLERMGSGWSEKFCAADFGDVTSRKRWFYSSHLLHIVPTPGSNRIRDIRDHAEDARVLARRNGHKAGTHQHYALDEVFATITSTAWHGHDIRGAGSKLIPFFPVALRGYSSAPIAKIFQEDEVFGLLLANSARGSALKTLDGCRNPSLLEMARAHSIPDSWDWAGTTKAQRGQIIANGWPIGMGTAICEAMLRTITAERERAA